MTPFPFRSTRAAINTTVSLIIDVTEQLQMLIGACFGAKKQTPEGVTLLLMNGLLRSGKG